MRNGEQNNGRLSRRKFIASAAVGAAAGVSAPALAAPAQSIGLPTKWDDVADVVIIGAGTTGIPAAIEAAERGATVIVIDQNSDVGGYGMISSGSVLTGGGTKLQKQHGVEDSADLRYRDLNDHRHQQTKKNDRALAKAFSNLCVETTDWLEKHGVEFKFNRKYFPQYTYASVERGHCAQWKEEDQTAKCPNKQMVWAGVTVRDMDTPTDVEVTRSTGAGLMRPLEAQARKMKEIKILLEHKLTRIFRDKHLDGDVVGIEAETNGKKVYLKARKGVIVASGGPKSNIQLRRLWDPRLTEIYQATGEPWSYHSGEGIIEAQKIGAQLTGDYGNDIHWTHARTQMGTRWHSVSAYITKRHSGKDQMGFSVKNPQDVIHVNMQGKRFFSEVPLPWDKQIAYVDAALANEGGPIWCLFDDEAVKRERWDPAFPTCMDGYFHRAQTLAELANKIKIPAAALAATVERYNSFVDKGKDEDFGKPSPRFKIQTAQFYAAWATPYLHDSRGGLRVNDEWQVLDINGKAIPRLYAGGEATGGLDLCGLAKSLVSGRIAGRTAALDKPME